MSIRIPKTFQLGGQTFRVICQEKEIDGGCAGLCNYDQGKVWISNKTRFGSVPADAQARVFCHELLHLVLDAAGERELSENESLVERCAVLLAQAFGSMK